MAGSDCDSQVFANVPEGFIKLLVSITKITIGPTTRPEFTLYQHKISDSVSMHQAAIQFKGGGVLKHATSNLLGGPCLWRGMLCRWVPVRLLHISGMLFLQ